MMENAIEIKNLSKEYRDFSLKNLSLNVPRGTVLGLIGENGAGKSTLIQSMLGLIKAEYEKIELLGKQLRNQEKEIKEDIAVIFDVSHYNPEYTPAFIGKMLKRVYRNWDMEKYDAYLSRFGLPADKKLKKFSKGMKMKLEFAIAFSHKPRLLILDEATSGLDPVFRDEILELIREFTEEEDHTVVMSSHITSDLDKVADYIAFLHEGKLQFVKSYDELQNDYGVLHCGKDFFESLREEDIVSFKKEPYEYKVLVRNRNGILSVFPDLEMEKASVEDIMLMYVKGEA
ncbi:ABC transporter ATP-binding protein [Blautia sp.]|jgi:ABC-2 type transport system ATP-binding protein|uniref:ABC transporter ATP-binding protein n=1 Tax=Blautia sp. TaxID=1955243 RepID=UPI003D8CA10A